MEIISAPAALPAAVLAASNGSDAPNTAVAATAAVGATLATTGDPPNCDDEPRQMVQDIAEEWVAADLINFSQRTIAPNNYAELMRRSLWDWSRPGAALRVIDVGGQLVSYDNRRLDAAREVGGRVRVQRVNPDDPFPGSTTDKTWGEKFKQRFNDPRNRHAGGCVPDSGLFDRPEWMSK